jgi:hypothetical protein
MSNTEKVIAQQRQEQISQMTPSARIRALSDDARSIMAKENYNPILELIRLSRNAEEESVAMACHKELAGYYAPKLKSVDVQQGHGNVTVIINKYGEDKMALPDNSDIVDV